MRKLAFIVFSLLLMTACTNTNVLHESETDENQEEALSEVEQSEGEVSDQYEELTEEDVAEILKDTLGIMSTELHEYFLETTAIVDNVSTDMKLYMEENPEQFEQELNAILDKGSIDAAKDKLYKTQVKFIEEYVYHFHVLHPINAEELSYPIEILDQDETNLSLSIYKYGIHTPLEKTDTMKITLEFVKIENDTWKLADYSYEEGMEELGLTLTKEIVEETYRLREYILDEEFTIVWEENSISDGPEMLSLSVNGSPMQIDTHSGLFIWTDF